MGWALILEHEGYKGFASYCNSDECYRGQIHGIPDLVTFEAKNDEDLKEEFVMAVEDYIKTLHKLGL